MLSSRSIENDRDGQRDTIGGSSRPSIIFFVAILLSKHKFSETIVVTEL